MRIVVSALAVAASRGWVDWPGHIWIRELNLGAIYSPTGTTVQFDNGTIWRRAPVRR
jgi:hypothetical protein